MMTRGGPEDARSGLRDLKIWLVAGEASGDHLGAELMRALRNRHRGQVAFAGVGGGEMEAAGLRSLFPISELSIIGVAPVLRALFPILRRINETADAVVAANPDVLVIIDSAAFTHRVARRVRAAVPSIPIVDYVSPQVWATRPGRARKMKAYIDCVLSVFAFEPQFHQQLGGPPCLYVGHPLIERAGDLRPGTAEAERRHTDPPVVLLLPGSRPRELRHLLARFGETARLVADRFGPIEFVLPTLHGFADRLQQATADWPSRPRIVTDPELKNAAFRNARAALAASGTVTLELAISRIPTVAAYRVTPWEAAIVRRLIRVPSLILTNLLIGERVVPEFLQQDCEPDRMADALVLLLTDTHERRVQIEAFEKLDAILGIGTIQPSDMAAKAVLATAGLGF
jgi:lipid-A-disaccharide synthase